MWAAERTDRGSQPPTERTEAMGGEAQDDLFWGQSEDFEGALWPHLGAKIITWKAEALRMGGRRSVDGGAKL